MRENLNSKNIEKHESNHNSDYKDLNARLKKIKSTIALLEKALFK